MKHPDDVPIAFQQSLDELQMDYVDLWLIHWPVAWKRGPDLMPKDANGNMILEDIDIADVCASLLRLLFSVTDRPQTYKAMEKIYHSGKAKAIGVSNCAKWEMEHLLKHCSVVPAVHQIECHPWLQQREFAEWHKEKGIHVTHYSAFGNSNAIYTKPGEKLGKLIDEPILADIGKKYGKTGAQVAIGMASLCGVFGS